MGYGIPSIIFSNYVNNDIVVEGLTGYNIPDTNFKLFANKIIDLNENRIKLNELKVNCIKYFNDHFSQEQHFVNLMKIYSDIRFDMVINRSKH
jgi:glycosyltransferase involved in cell wall biosynthesis